VNAPFLRRSLAADAVEGVDGQPPATALRRLVDLALGKMVTLVLAAFALVLGLVTFVVLAGGAPLGVEPNVVYALVLANLIVLLALGSVLAGVIGGFSTIVYPDNMGMLRATRVGSRYATLAAGVLLIALGSVIKFDMLLVVVPQPVVSAAATLLFGIVFMHGVQMLAKVDWDERKFIVAGLAMLVGLGGMFVSPQALAAMPLLARLFVQQPVISGGLTLVILHSLLCRGAVPQST